MMNRTVFPCRALVPLLLFAFAFVAVPRSDAARGRPVLNAAGTTFVSDSGTLLRGPRVSTELGAVPTAADMQTIKSYGCNALHCYAERADYGYSAGAQATAVDALVQLTGDNGLYLIITIGNGGVNAAFSSAFWNFYAPRYAAKTHVLYEIQNEATTGAPSSSAVISMEKAAYAIIHAAAPSTPVLFMSYEAMNNGSGVLQDIAALGTVDWSKAGIAFHGYGTGRAATRSALQTVLAAGYPCFQTEFYRWPWGTGNFALASAASLYQDTDETGDYERLGVSWLNFLSPAAMTSDDRYKTKLANAGIVWTPDYGTWPSGSRSVHGNGGEPWSVVKTGTTHIEAEDFDNGGEGIAYHDLTASNSGAKYRTGEGVDIESTTDTNGGYDVGWISTGEWLEYTTYVTDPGLYTLSIRVASPQTANSLRVKFGGVDKTGTWAFNGTGANQTWTTITKTVSLAPGQQVMHIDALSSGFNLNWIELTPAATGLVANGTYKVLNRNSGKAMDVVNASTADGASIQQWSYSATANQKWVLTHKGANQYTITSSQTGKGIDEESYNSLSGPYVDVYALWNGTGSTNQRWIVTPTDSGYYQIVSVNSGLVLEIPGSSTANGTLIDQQEYGATNTQQWLFGTP